MKNFATMGASDGECFLACGLIWVSGAGVTCRPILKSASTQLTVRENGEYRKRRDRFLPDAPGVADGGNPLFHRGRAG